MSRAARWTAPLLTALLSLLAGPLALWPTRTYFFRDFSVTFEPTRELFLRELRAGRWPGWNPYSYEGTAQFPLLYPVDLLQLAAPSPVFASWLLTLHLPLAALAMYALARELGASRLGASAAGLAFALGGLAQSSLNLCVFLEALALAPLVVLTLVRASRTGGVWIAAAAAAIALSISTLAVEFVAQGVVLGLALALVVAERPRGALRGFAATLLGAGIAALPILVLGGMVAGSLRSVGHIGELQRSLHPLSLLQVLVPDFFLSLAEPLRWGWSHRLSPEGLPYFLSFYLGPFVLALAVVGVRFAPPRVRLVLLACGLAGLWYALGRYAGLAPALAPLLPSIRFPVKAMLLPHLCVALFVGWGASGLEKGRAWGAWALALLVGIGTAAAVAAAGRALAPRVADELWVAPDTVPVHLALLERNAVLAGMLALLAVLAFLARGRLLREPVAAAVVVLFMACDLARAASGMNPQTAPVFYQPLPEMRALVGDLHGGRVLTLGYGLSPRMNAVIGSRTPGVELVSFFLYRQLLNPMSNLLDDVELAGGRDLHSFIPNEELLKDGDYAPTAIGAVLPRLRAVAVSRVVSLDPVEHAELRLLGTVPTGLEALAIHVYAVSNPWPRAYVACHVEQERDPHAAFERTLAADFDAARGVVLEQQAPAACTDGSVERRRLSTGLESYDVEADAAGVLVMRDSYARGWQAEIDGAPAPVLRANGRHRAVAVPAGRHQVRLSYHPPGGKAGVALSLVSLAATALVFARARRRGEAPRTMV